MHGSASSDKDTRGPPPKTSGGDARLYDGVEDRQRHAPRVRSVIAEGIPLTVRDPKYPIECTKGFLGNLPCSDGPDQTLRPGALFGAELWCASGVSDLIAREARVPTARCQVSRLHMPPSRRSTSLRIDSTRAPRAQQCQRTGGNQRLVPSSSLLSQYFIIATGTINDANDLSPRVGSV